MSLVHHFHCDLHVFAVIKLAQLALIADLVLLIRINVSQNVYSHDTPFWNISRGIPVELIWNFRLPIIHFSVLFFMILNNIVLISMKTFLNSRLWWLNFANPKQCTYRFQIRQSCHLEARCPIYHRDGNQATQRTRFHRIFGFFVFCLHQPRQVRHQLLHQRWNYLKY